MTVSKIINDVAVKKKEDANMPIATIIEALVGTAGTLIGGGMTVRSQKEANRMNLALAEQERQDTLKQQKISNQLAQQSLSLSRRGIEFQEREAALSRDERAEQTGYDRLQHAADKLAEYRNSKVALRQQQLAPLMKGR